LQNLQPVGCQPDANFIQSVAIWMQISFSRLGDANFIQSAAIWMQISFSQLPAGCKLHPASGYAIQNTQFACVGD
jgi:hypothetical protein